MATTAETYGFGARAPYATPRASEHDMKEKARLSGLFPRVRNEPMSKQLQVLLKEFEQNAALTALLERRRALEGRSQYNLQGREAMDDVNRNLAPWARTGRAVEANSARVAQQVAGITPPATAPDAANVMMGGGAAASTGGSESSTQGAAPKAKAKAKTKARSQSRGRQSVADRPVEVAQVRSPSRATSKENRAAYDALASDPTFSE